MIDPNKELFKWGPIDGKILYINSFMDYMVCYKKKFGKSWPDIMCHFKENKILALCEYQILRKYGKEIFNEFVLNKKLCKKTYNHWFNIAEEIKKWCYKHRISDLSKLSEKELSNELKKFNKIYKEFWVYGFIPEVANWGGEKILMEHIERNYPNDFNEIFEALTAPEELSFYQIEEKDLLTEDIVEHAQKYFWIKNSYGGVTFFTKEMFKKQLLETSKDKIKEIDNFLSDVKKKKKEIKQKFKIPNEIMNLASRLSFSIWWQDFRKKYIFMSLHVIHHFAKEIAKRNCVSEEDIEFYNPRELVNLAKRKIKIDLY